ncbi:MFS transporter [Pseudomonas sp. A014]|uniref:MFS transporter n=1 Tax=Pseudomonas sp. A014 TaxID=3458058 RepID=UPI004036AECB
MSSSGKNLPVASSLNIHAVTLVAYSVAASAPTPLYRLYQVRWQFSSGLLTLIFGAYSFALLLTLLMAGRLSDYIGRRPVISFGLALQLAAMGLFLTEDGPSWLIAARLLQGVASGLASAALGASLIDLNHSRGALINSLAPMAGMALGALGSTALVQLVPAPMYLTFVLLLVVFSVQLRQTWRTPETVIGRSGALRSLWPSLAVPLLAKAELLAVMPINVAVWALAGFYLSLMPSLIVQVTGSDSVWLGGLSVAALTMSAGVAILIMRRRRALTVLIMGAAALVVGVLAILVGANLGLAAVLLFGSVTAGVGVGAGFLGALSSVMPLAEPGQRAGLVAVFHVGTYLAFSLPAIFAGYLTQHLDLLKVTNFYGAVLALLALTGLILTLARHQRRKNYIDVLDAKEQRNQCSNDCGT